MKPFEEFWELVITKPVNSDSVFLRQAFISQEAAVSRAEDDNLELREGEANQFPIKWKNDHHGGVEGVGHPSVGYYVFPRRVYPKFERD